MKQSKYSMLRILLPVVFGSVGGILRSVYFKTAQEPGGCLRSWQPAQIAYWILAGFMILTAFVLGRKKGVSLRKERNNVVSGLSCLIMGVALGINTLMMDPSLGFYGLLRLLGWIAAACLAAGGIAGLLHKSLGLVPVSALCIFLILYAVGSYAQWRSIPEMERFLTPALTLLLLLPFSCEMAALSQGAASVPWFLTTGMLVCFFSISALGCPGSGALQLGAGIWSLLAIIEIPEEGAIR